MKYRHDNHLIISLFFFCSWLSHREFLETFLSNYDFYLKIRDDDPTLFPQNMKRILDNRQIREGAVHMLSQLDIVSQSLNLMQSDSSNLGDATNTWIMLSSSPALSEDLKLAVKLRMKKTAGEKISLYLDIYYNGRRQYDFLKLYLLKGTDSKIKAANKETLELAEMIRAKRQIEFQYSDHDIIPKFKRDADFVEYFKTLGQSKGASSTLWESTLNHLRTFTGGKLAFKNIDERWLEKWQNYLLDKVSRNSAHTYQATIIAGLNRAVKDRILHTNPYDRVNKIKLEDTKREFLTFDEIKQLSVTIPETERGKEVARMFLFGCFTGLSSANLETLTFGQIEGDTVNFFRTKTKTWQNVPLNETALSLIGETNNKEVTQIVFKVISRSHRRFLLKKWVKQAGIKKHLHFHLARHTFATQSLANGANLYTVSKLLGHKEIKTTQIYAKVIDEDKRKAVNAIPQLESMQFHNLSRCNSTT